MRRKALSTLPLLRLLPVACRRSVQPVSQTGPSATRTPGQSAGSQGATGPTFLPDIPQRMAKLPPTAIDYDRSLLRQTERRVVAVLLDASRRIDDILLRQVSEENPARARSFEAP